MDDGVGMTAWLERGHRIAGSGRTDDLLSALNCYDRARELYPAAAATRKLRHQLGLAWMNRGNLLQQLRRPGDLDAALAAYDAAVEAMASVGEDAAVANAIGAALVNRAQVHQQWGDETAAARDLAGALEWLQPLLGPEADIAPARNAAGAAVGLVQHHLAAGRASEAIALAGDARGWVEAHAADDIIASTLALELARLELIARESDLTHESLGAFTDTVETALTLAARWLPHGHPTANELAARLFQLGAFTYARSQPHFLLEFLREALDPAAGSASFAGQAEFHRISAEAISLVERELARPRVLMIDDERSHHLAALRHAFSAPRPWLHGSK